MQHFLLASPQMQEMAAQICAEKKDILPCQVEWRRFPDTFPDIFVASKADLIGQHVSYLMCLDSPETIFEQLSLMIDLSQSRLGSFKVLLPYFPTGTMERKDHEGQVSTAATLARLMSTIAPAGPGPVSLFMWDIHALQIRHYPFGDNIVPCFKSWMKRLREKMIASNESYTLAFPDQGAWKRYRVLFQNDEGQDLFPLVVCSKVRDGEQRIIKIQEGDPRGRHCVIVDDIFHTCGTTLNCGEVLFEAGAAKVSAAATHAVMENESWRRFEDSGFSKVWISDSCPKTAKAVEDIEMFETLSLKGSISRAILTGK